MRVGSFSCCKPCFISLQHYSDFNRLQLIFPARPVCRMERGQFCTLGNNGFATQSSYNGRMKESQIKIKLDPVPRVNSCPRGFCCCVKLDSGYQVSKVAEIFSVNQRGALEKQLDLSR